MWYGKEDRGRDMDQMNRQLDGNLHKKTLEINIIKQNNTMEIQASNANDFLFSKTNTNMIYMLSIDCLNLYFKDRSEFGTLF